MVGVEIVTVDVVDADGDTIVEGVGEEQDDEEEEDEEAAKIEDATDTGF